MNLDLHQIKQAVQKNCHIADATAAGDYTLCIYLLKMREFYRWEQGINFGDALPNATVGNWLRSREQLWEVLQDESFAPITIDGTHYDPFDSAAINSALTPQHLIYSGGFGYNVKPHFFLGVLEKHEAHQDFDIYVSGDEYACDLTSPPAMSQGKNIYIRRDALRRMLWEKYEQWLWNKPDNALGRAVAYYDFEHDLDSALDVMTSNELQSIIWHEIGEVNAHYQLGEGWEKLLLHVPHSKLEIMLRAIRDLYADSLSTLPQLLEQENVPALHFFFANLTNMRKHLFPGITAAYENWHRTGDRAELHRVSQEGEAHWGGLCQQVLAYVERHPTHFTQPLVELIENSRL
jgi:hypothetical protein